MANRDTPCGFRPAHGVGSPHQYKLFRVDATGNATYNVGIGSLMDLDGYGVNCTTAGPDVSAAGVCVAVYDSNMIPCGHPSSAVSTKYLSAATDGYALVALATPGAVFIGQTSTGVALTENDVGLATDNIGDGTNAVSTTTGRATDELNSTTGQGQLRIIGKVERPDNAWGEHVDVYFVFNESAFGGNSAASV
ncbi:MAG: hypothetical protein KKE30_01700 [Gammaproteobacteria bacterium]|nr:hypothetical protein [Gammaproteobacteria bacterium]